MELSRIWNFIIFIVLYSLQKLHTTGKNIKNHDSTIPVNKRHLVGRIGRRSVEEPSSSVPQAALAQAKGNPGDKSSEVQSSNQGFHNSGCYKDTESRAVPSLEGSDPDLKEFYKQRQEPISKCASVARGRGYQLFAIQNGGMCLSGPKAHETYKIHGMARNCKDGKGGEWANDVYIFNDFPQQLHIFTGREPEAGTDANIYITLSGSMGTSRRISLSPEDDNQNPFEAGKQDVFNVHTIPLGSISKIAIGQDDTGEKRSDWFLQKVVVKDSANTMYKFEVNRWLAKDKDDGQTERELSLTATITPGSYKPIGCFKERTDVNKDRAIPSLEGRDDVLDGQGTTPYRAREFPIEKCADAAKRRGYVMFAIQDGGLCATSKEIQNTYDIYGEGEDCGVNGTGSAFSSSVYSFSDNEPTFQEADSSVGGVEEGSQSNQNQPAPPSDPAMQLAGQRLSSPSQGSTNSSPNKQEPTTTKGSATKGDGPNTEKSDNQKTGSTNENAVNEVQSKGATAVQSSKSNAPNRSAKINQRPTKTSEDGNEPARNVNKADGPKSVGPNGSTQSTPKRNPESKKDNEMTNRNTGANSEGNNNGNSQKSMGGLSGQTTGTQPKQNSETTNYPVITDATPQQAKIHPGRNNNQIPRRTGEEYVSGEGTTGSRVNTISAETKTPIRQTFGEPVIEAPLLPRVHKIAPETRFPGEFASPSNEGQTKQDIKRPFSKLLDAQQRDNIRRLV